MNLINNLVNNLVENLVNLVTDLFKSFITLYFDLAAESYYDNADQNSCIIIELSSFLS